MVCRDVGFSSLSLYHDDEGAGLRVGHPVLKKCRSRCFKIPEKVSFNIASEASYVYILSGQKLIKNAKKMVHLASVLKTEACS